MPTVVVTGASGLLGRALCEELRRDGRYEVRGVAHRRLAPGLDALDLRDATATERFVDAVRPAAILHAAAERRPDAAERDPAATRRLNVDASAVLGRAARAAGAWLIYVSTDYVFDGSAPPYRPDDAPNPLNAYGRSKLEGERATLHEHPGASVLRLPILYGAVERLDESAVTAIAADLLGGSGPLELDDWAVRRPTHTANVASVCRQLLAHKAAQPAFAGVHHWSAGEAYTKYAMGRLMAELLARDPARLLPRREPGPGAPRPRDTTLDCSSLAGIVRGARSRLADRLPEILGPFRPAC